MTDVKTFRVSKSFDNVYRIGLPFGFAVGVSWPMVRAPLDWRRWDRYVYYDRWRQRGITAWQVRVLWFYLGRLQRVQHVSNH